jgi:hypothetical protein
VSLHSDGRFDLRENCLRVDPGDPFIEDLRARRVNVLLGPQKECSQDTE